MLLLIYRSSFFRQRTSRLFIKLDPTKILKVNEKQSGSTVMSFVRFHKSSMPLFNISIITATGSSIGTDGCKCTTSKEVCMLVSDIFHSFAFSTNEDESKTLCLFLFKVGCFTLTKYFNMPYGGDLRVDTAALMGYAHFSLVYVPLKFRTI